MPRIVLYGETDRRYAIEAVKAAKIGMEVRVVKPSRTVEQNALWHAQLGDISKQIVRGNRTNQDYHDVEWWKRRITLAWLIDTKQEREIITDDIRGTDEFAMLLPHTSDLKAEQFASLIEWTYAFGAQNSVVFKHETQSHAAQGTEA